MQFCDALLIPFFKKEKLLRNLFLKGLFKKQPTRQLPLNLTRKKHCVPCNVEGDRYLLAKGQGECKWAKKLLDCIAAAAWSAHGKAEGCRHLQQKRLNLLIQEMP